MLARVFFRVQWMALLLIVSLTLVSCSRPSTEKRIQGIAICEYNEFYECDRPSVTLTPNAPYLMATAEIGEVPVNRAVVVDWHYLGFEADMSSLIATQIYPKNTTAITSVLALLSQPDNGWPIGDYEVVLSVDDDSGKSIRQSFVISPAE